jgi:DNA-binding transcriptional regulator YiaG
MTTAQISYGAIPDTGKLAGRFCVTDVAPGKANVLKRVRRKRGDETDDMILLHVRTMPSFLTSVKPSELVLCQVPELSQNMGMTSDTKPFSDIAERILWHRKLLGMEQKEYAERAGLQRSQLSNWETGATRLSLDGARALRRTYGLSLDFMYEGIDEALSMTLRNAWSDAVRVKSSR